MEFGILSLFLFDVFAQLANVRLQISVEHQLQATCLPCPVLFGALLTEMPRHDKGLEIDRPSKGLKRERSPYNVSQIAPD